MIRFLPVVELVCVWAHGVFAQFILFWSNRKSSSLNPVASHLRAIVLSISTNFKYSQPYFLFWFDRLSLSKYVSLWFRKRARFAYDGRTSSLVSLLYFHCCIPSNRFIFNNNMGSERATLCFYLILWIIFGMYDECACICIYVEQTEWTGSKRVFCSSCKMKWLIAKAKSFLAFKQITYNIVADANQSREHSSKAPFIRIGMCVRINMCEWVRKWVFVSVILNVIPMLTTLDEHE